MQLHERASAPSAHSLSVYGGGHVALFGSKLRLHQALDRLFLSWAGTWQAQDHQFPAVIPAHELNKIDYFKSFPHHMTLPVGLDADHDNLKEFSEREPLDSSGTLRLTRCAPVTDVLTPAACYHFYVNFQGETFDAPRYVTTKATCFRRETHYAPLQRQWSFSMREIVCLGTAPEVLQFLESARRLLDSFFEDIDLPIHWQAATDPFFSPQSNPKYLAQKLEPVKTEMIFRDTAADNELSIGSINFHRNYFGETFRMSRAGEEAFSGCVAFGIDRWTHAFLRRFGEDEHHWPNLEPRES